VEPVAENIRNEHPVLQRLAIMGSVELVSPFPPTLTSLDITRIDHSTPRLNQPIGHLKSLRELRLSGVSVEAGCETTDIIPHVEKATIRKSPGAHRIIMSIGRITFLTTDVESLGGFEANTLPAAPTAIDHMHLDCSHARVFPALSLFANVKSLHLENIFSFSLLSSLGSLNNLLSLNIGIQPQIPLVEIPNTFVLPSGLHELQIDVLTTKTKLVFPPNFQFPPSLTSIVIDAHRIENFPELPLDGQVLQTLYVKKIDLLNTPSLHETAGWRRPEVNILINKIPLEECRGCGILLHPSELLNAEGGSCAECGAGSRCPICDFYDSEVYTCDRCGERVCGDCMEGEGDEVLCKRCGERAEKQKRRDKRRLQQMQRMLAAGPRIGESRFPPDLL
jgi:hypothetical protein